MARTTFSATLTLAALSLSLSTLAFTPAMTEVDGRAVPQIEWKTTLSKFGFDKDKFAGQRFTAMCPPASPKLKAGDGDKDAVYPKTHSICLAGLQAGTIDKKGGLVTIQVNPVGAVHAGSVGKGKALSMSVVGPTGTEALNQIYRENIQQVNWDTKFTKTGVAYKHLVGQRFSFQCPKAPSNMITRRVTGTDLYAFNSLICRAAVHAGKLTTDGGVVTVQMNPKTKKLVGSTQNGIETKDGSSGLSALSFVDNPVNP